MRLGFVGIGTLSGAVIKALVDVQGDQFEIVVSPRSEARSRSLAARHDSIRRAASNQEAVDAADVVFLGVRPQQMTDVLSTLTFRPDQTVVSFIAGATNAQVLEQVAPAGRVVRVTPLPPIARRAGPIVIFPAAPDIERMFAGLGTVIVPETQEQVMALGYGGGLMASFFEMANAGIRWLGQEGVPVEMGRDYLMSMYAALGAIGLNTPSNKLPALPGEFSTAGGINEACLHHLTAAGWFDDVSAGLEAMKLHLETLPGDG